MLDENYEDNLNTLTTQMEYSIYSVDGVMNPTKMETIFENIVTSLNILYEKSRLLDELYYYTKNKVSDDIEKQILETKKLIAFIDNNEDSYTKQACYSKSISFAEQSPIRVLKDRDGSTLLKASISDRITLPCEEERLSVDKISKTTTEYCYQDNLSSVNKGNETFYKSFYSLEQPNEIIETITFLFDTPIGVNKFSLESFGSNIQKITAQNSEEESFEIDTDSIIVDTIQDVKKVFVELQTNKYAKKQLTTDKSILTNNEIFSGGDS